MPPALPVCAVERDALVVLLVRHAQSEANADGSAEQDTDSPLTALGVEQAEALARAFSDTVVGGIVSSDFRRACSTVAPLAASQGKTVALSERLREPRSNRRSTQVMDAHEAAALLERLRAGAPSPAPLLTETHAELVARLRGFLESSWASGAQGTVVICSHYGTLNVLVRLLIDHQQPPASLWAHFDNASVTRVDVPRSRLRPAGILKYLNWVPPR